MVGGRRIDRPGAFVEPTVLTGVTPAMRAYEEELFGPVAVVYRVADDAEAVALANASPFGLGAAVFAGDAGAGPSRRRPARVRDGVDQPSDLVGAAPALRRHQGLGLRPRAAPTSASRSSPT